jgi:hypothetical protein
MSRFVVLICAAVLFQSSTDVDRQKFAKYTAIEAYEVQPGVLVMPRYAPEGQVCEVGLEKRHYSAKEISLNPSLSRGEIYRIFVELVPERVRGNKSGREDLTRAGHSITTTIQFENVSLQIVSEELSTAKKEEIVEGDTVGIIRWKARRCQ